MAILTYVVAAAALGALFRRKKPASETPGGEPGETPGGGQAPGGGGSQAPGGGGGQAPGGGGGQAPGGGGGQAPGGGGGQAPGGGGGQAPGGGGGQGDDDKPADKPAATPPAGSITVNEKQAADAQLLLKLNTIDPSVVPVPTNARKPGQSDADWFTNVAFWTAYRSPTSPWTKQYAAGPVKVADGPNGPWATAWKRIHAYIVAQLAGGQGDDDKPADKPAAAPPAGSITVNEKQAADAQLLLKLNTIDPSVVPVPTNARKPGQSDADWFTNVAFWTAYRSPTSPWTKQYAAGPVKVADGPNGPWATAWKRIHAYIVAQLAGGQGDDDKPADKPAAAPPAGSITVNEKQAADAQLLLKLNTIDPSVVPVPTNARKPGQSDADWFTNVAFWTAYRSPTSPWTKQYAAGPVKVADGPNGPWATAWKRIHAYIVAQLAGGQGDDDKPADKPAAAPPAGSITVNEKQAADAQLLLKLNTIDPSVVPVPTNARKPGQSDADWFTNVAFWTAYRSPTSPWTKQYAAGPVKVADGPNGPWATAWKRINAFIVAQLAGQAPADDKPVDQTGPAAGPITILEKDAADGALWLQPDEVDAAFVPAPTNVRKDGQPLEEWLTNVSFWTAYRSPTSPWVKQHPPGPVKITDGPNGPWASSWKRINAYVIGKLGG